MKSTGVIVVLILVLLGVGGFLFLNNKKATSPAPATTTETKKQGSLVTSIKDALSKSATLECTYADATGHQVKSYIKNGAIRSDITGATAKESGSTIVKNNKMYYWSGTTGFMMEFNPDQMKGTPLPTSPKTTGTQTQQNPIEQLEKYKDACKSAVVSDSLFTPPADIKFTDYSQMMKSIPTANPSGAMSQDDIKKMMEKYAPTGQ